jgi:hypothetical protein
VTDGPPLTPTFEHGVRVASAVNGAMLVWLYAVAAPSKDIRARIPFLLANFSPATWFQVALIATVAGLLGLAITGGWSRRAVGGVLVGAVLSLVLLESGLVGEIIPAGRGSPPKYWLLAVAIVAAGLALWHARRQVRNRRAA